MAGYAVVFGGQDIVGDTFTKETDFWFDRLTQNPMVLYQHGQDGMLKRSVVGRVTQKRTDDIGLWVEAQISASKQYADAIRKLVSQGLLGWSSGSVPHLVQRTKGATPGTAQITSWPIVEISLTPTPAEPRTIGVKELKSLAALEPALEAVLEDADAAVEDARTDASKAQQGLPASDYAWVDSDGVGHLDISDEGHVRAAMARFNQTNFTEDGAKRSAARKIIARAHSMGIDVSPDSAVAMAAKAVAMDTDELDTADYIGEVGWRFIAMQERIKGDRAAMERLGEDTKDGHRLYVGARAELEELVNGVVHRIGWAKSIDEGEDDVRRVNYYKHKLALLALEAS